MARIRIGRILVFTLVVVVAAGIAAPFIDAEGYRGRIEAALERALNRKVKVGAVRFNLFTGPGFTVKEVEIADDPSVGIEPLAYVTSLEARVTLRTLWSRKLSFSNLKLKQPTLNLVKTDGGAWNYQLLHTATGSLPTIQARGARINFKFGDTKSVFYLSESDLDINPLDSGTVDVRFAGQPARSDQPAQSFGQLLARGVWKRSGSAEAQLDLNAELERSAITEIARLLEGRGIGVHGVVSARTHISGPISKLAITGQTKLEDVHRWDLLPKGGAWQLNYSGLLDLTTQRVELEAGEKDNPGMPVLVRVRASDLLSNPRLAASTEFRDVPAGAIVEAARHMGVVFPEGIQVEGRLSGAVGVSRPGGILQGQLSAADATVRSPGAPVIKFRAADVLIDGDNVTVGPSTAETDTGSTAGISASYSFQTGAMRVDVSSTGMDAGELRKGVGLHIPVLSDIGQGVWSGALHFEKTAEDSGAWSGQFDVRDARTQIPGLSEPVRFTGAVALEGSRLSVTRIRGHAGAIPFSGDYRADAKGGHARLHIAETSITALEQALAPTLRRNEGLLARFRIRKPPLPEWLHDRHVDALVSIDALSVGDQSWSVRRARIDWNGAAVKLASIEALKDEAAITGSADIDLSGPSPDFKFSGRVNAPAFRGGSLALDVKGSTHGLGTSFLANSKAEGTFDAADANFPPDFEFKTLTGAFEWAAPGRLKLMNVQAVQGFETYTGQGSAQADGKLSLELVSNGKHQVKVAGTLFR